MDECIEEFYCSYCYSDCARWLASKARDYIRKGENWSLTVVAIPPGSKTLCDGCKAHAEFVMRLMSEKTDSVRLEPLREAEG